MTKPKCPVCHKELQEGFLNGPSQQAQFFPKEIEIPYWRTIYTVVEGATLVSRFRVFSKDYLGKNIHKIPAYFCSTCQKITIDLKEQVR